MRRSIRWMVLGLFALAMQPVWAVCGVDEVCVVIPPNSSAQDIVNLVEGSWDLPDFACGADITPSGVRVTADANNGTRVLQFVVPPSGTALGHSVTLRFAVPLSRLFEPFDIFLNFDGQGEVELSNGTSQFADITINVSTLNLPPSGAAASLPAMDDVASLALIVGLIGGGLGILLVLRRE